jgi:hypothetical protein
MTERGGTKRVNTLYWKIAAKQQFYRNLGFFEKHLPLMREAARNVYSSA